MNNNNDNNKCAHCDSTDTFWTINPYDQDINGIEKWEWMCNYCYESSCGDI